MSWNDYREVATQPKKRCSQSNAGCLVPDTWECLLSGVALVRGQARGEARWSGQLPKPGRRAERNVIVSKRPIVLRISVFLNLCLAGTLVYHRTPGSHFNPTIDSNGHSARPAFLPGQALGFRWSELESTDYRNYAENLRKIGCPEETVQDIILAEINHLYAPKIRAVQQGRTGKRHYWQPEPAWSPDNSAAQNAVITERNGVIKELLGIDFDEYNRTNDPSPLDQDGPCAFLADVKQRQVRALEEKYRELRARIYAASHGVITAEDRTALTQLEQQQAAEMDALLTPNERFEYGLRNSATSLRLQRDLEAFNPNETEFRAIYQAQTAIQDRAPASNTTSNAGNTSQATADDAEAAVTAQLRAALGDQRFIEYQWSQDSGYQTLIKIADRFGLPPQTVAAEVLNMKQDVEQQKRQVLADSSLDAGQKQVRLQALQDQVGTVLATVLGEKGFSTYHDYAGSWIDQLGR